MDRRLYAEIYAALWILSESAGHGDTWRAHLKHLCARRTLHRRRYAARRMVGAVGGRFEQTRQLTPSGPSCLLLTPNAAPRMHLEEPLDIMCSRLLTILSLIWRVPAERVEGEMARELRRNSGLPADLAQEGVVPLDSYKRRRRRRMRIDQRRGRAAQGPR